MKAVGLDAVEIARVAEAIARHGDRFLARIYSDEERRIAKASGDAAAQFYAGRFAAKEAVLKAVSQVEPRRVLAMNQVEVRNDGLGRPRIILHDRGGRASRLQIHVSLSHVDTVAVASAIAIR